MGRASEGPERSWAVVRKRSFCTARGRVPRHLFDLVLAPLHYAKLQASMYGALFFKLLICQPASASLLSGASPTRDKLPSGCDGSVVESQRGRVRQGLETSLTSNQYPTMNSPAECSEALAPPRKGNRARELLRGASVSIWERADLGALSFKSGQDQNWRRLARAESPEGAQCGCRLPTRQQAFHCGSRRRPSLRTAHG